MIPPVKEKTNPEPVGLTIGDVPIATFVKDPPIESVSTARSPVATFVGAFALAAAAGATLYWLLRAKRE